jgi:hypothetical protein
VRTTSEHPDTLATRANLPRFTGDAGDATRARDLYAELLRAHERILGAEQPDVLISRNDVAY